MMANQARDQAMKIAVVITDGRSANSTATIQEAVYARQVWGSVHFTLFRTLGRSLCWGYIQFTLLRTLDRSLYWGSIQFTLFRTLGRSLCWGSVHLPCYVPLTDLYSGVQYIYPVPYLGQVSILGFYTVYPVPYLGQVSILGFYTIYPVLYLGQVSILGLSTVYPVPYLEKNISCLYSLFSLLTSQKSL